MLIEQKINALENACRRKLIIRLTVFFTLLVSYLFLCHWTHTHVVFEQIGNPCINCASIVTFLGIGVLELLQKNRNKFENYAKEAAILYPPKHTHSTDLYMTTFK